MALIQKKKECWFNQNASCVINSKWPCFICPWHIREITNLSNVKDYIDVVNNKRLVTRTLTISIITIIIAAFAAFVSLLGIFFKDVDLSPITSALGF